MRRFTMTMALVATMVVPVFAERVTPETARMVATTFLNNNGAKTTQLTDLSKIAGFENLYIFTTESSFVVMSADDCVKPILGYSFNGKFVAEDLPENVYGWLQEYNDEIQFTVNNKMKATTESSRLWKELAEGKSGTAKATVVVAPLIQTKWNQNGYGNVYLFNNLCPSVASGGHGGHAYTGCVATAMAQIMKYWEYPSKGIGFHSYVWKGQTLSADFGSTPYDWQHMTDTYSNTSTAEEKYAVDLLMYHCGISVDMDYGGSGSSASTSKVMEVLQIYFNYVSSMHYGSKSDYTDAQWIAMVKAELDENRPLQYRGSGKGGHSFVCDGYNSDDYFHFNWGWAGSCDGYYSVEDLTTINPGTGGGNGSYTDNQKAIFGIQPVQCDASNPVNLTYELNGPQSLTLNWDAAADAASYNIYRNNYYIGNTSTTTFTETAPFGTNVYWVRSIDANNELSLSSNMVTVTIDYQTPIVNDLTSTFSNNEATLFWTEPEWCYPETPTDTLSYGDGNLNYVWNFAYYAHRYLAEDLAQYANKAVYKISTYILYPGTYSAFVFTNTTDDSQPDANSCAMSKEGVIVSLPGWFDFTIENPIPLSGENDFWIVIKQENTGQKNPTPSFDLPEYNPNAFYAGRTSPTNLFSANSNYIYAWFIKAYLTDGTYTYNIYDGSNKLNQEAITDTSYTIENPETDAIHQYTIKTNYYGGESKASNKAYLAKGTKSLETLDLSDDNMTIAQNSTLTVGSLTNSDPANLILENGAQLIHNSTGVKATVKKDVAAYTSKLDGWNLIASPVTENITPSGDNGLFSALESDTIDLYYYSEPEHKWKNYQKQAFSIEHQKGYLYANNKTDGMTLNFAGTLTPSDEPMTINNLSYSATTLNGINLVGNPFVCNATVNKDFYVMNEDRTRIVVPASDRQIAPCEGIFVQVSEADPSVTFTKAGAKSRSLSSSFDLTLTQGHTTLDRARVRFEDKEGLEKFSLNENTGNQIYFPQDGKGYAVACISEQNELPLNFEAAENGTYTLSINTENVNLKYLHLIDNLTGNDVDLLTTPDYTFEAKTSDYASRFRLVFSDPCEDTNDDDATPFAYVSNGNIIITGIDGDAGSVSLQIVDMLGRVIVSQGDVSGNISTANMPAGVYVLHLSNAQTTRTQKIVVQ